MRQVFHLFSLALVFALIGCNSVAVTPGAGEKTSTASRAAPMKVSTRAETAPAGAVRADADLSPDLLYQLLVAEIAGQRGQYGRSAATYLAVARHSGDARLARRATRIAVYARQFDVALDAAELWAAQDPSDLEARQSVAALLIRAGRSDDAVAHLARLVSMAGGGEHEGLMMASSLLGRDQDRQRALRIMERLIEARRDEPEALYAYANLANTLGETDKALATVDEALALRADWPQALALKASILHAAGKAEEALSTLHRAVENKPDDSSLRLGYARLLVDTGRLDEARKQFELLSEQMPGNADVKYTLALLALEAKDLDEAERRFGQLLTSGQRQNEAAFSLGQIAEARGQWEKAIEWYSSVARESKAFLDAQVRISVLLSENQGLDQGRRYLHDIGVESADEKLRLYLVEGELLRDSGDYGQAKATYDEALAIFVDHPELLYARALVEEKLGRIDLLEQDLRRILEVDPSNTQALNALGYTLADRTKRYEEAFGYISQAFERAPHDPAVIDSMGWVLYRMGRFEESIEYLRRAAELSQDAEIAAHFGTVLWASGQRGEAREVWDDALKHSPEHPLLKEVIERHLK